MNLDVFLTKKCNMKCVFCGAWVEENCPVLLPEDLKIIFKEGKAFGFRYTTLSGGEPLIYPYFKEAVEIAVMNGFWVNVTTNGLLIDQGIIDFLKSKNVNLRISLHTLKKEKHQAITGNDTWDIIVNNIKLLQKNKMYFSQGCTIYADNVSEIESMAEFAFESGAAYIRYTPVVGVNKGSGYETDREFYRDSLKRIVNVVLKYRSYISYEKSELSYSGQFKKDFISLMTTRRCPAGSNLFMIIDSDYNLLPCQFIPMEDGWYQHCDKMSSISEEFLSLRNNMMNHFRESRHKEHNGICKECEYVGTCLGGCLANRLPKSRKMEDEQDICILSLVNEVLEALKQEDQDFLIDYWMYYFNQRITKKDRNLSCMRKLPIWEINFRMDVPRM